MQKRAGRMGVVLLTFLALITAPALADDIDAKIKKLEEMEAWLFEGVTQEEVAPGAFCTHQRSPEGAFWREALS